MSPQTVPCERLVWKQSEVVLQSSRQFGVRDTSEGSCWAMLSDGVCYKNDSAMQEFPGCCITCSCSPRSRSPPLRSWRSSQQCFRSLLSRWLFTCTQSSLSVTWTYSGHAESLLNIIRCPSRFRTITFPVLQPVFGFCSGL